MFHALFRFGLVFACLAPAAQAVEIPYDTTTENRYTFSWTGLGPIDAIDGDASETVWIVDVPAPGGSYLVIGGYIASVGGPSDFQLLLNGAPAEPWVDSGVSSDGALTYQYRYGGLGAPDPAGAFLIPQGPNTFELIVTVAGAPAGEGVMIFSNDPGSIVPIPAPAAFWLMAPVLASTILAAMRRRRVHLSG